VQSSAAAQHNLYKVSGRGENSTYICGKQQTQKHKESEREYTRHQKASIMPPGKKRWSKKVKSIDVPRNQKHPETFPENVI